MRPLAWGAGLGMREGYPDRSPDGWMARFSSTSTKSGGIGGIPVYIEEMGTAERNGRLVVALLAGAAFSGVAHAQSFTLLSRHLIYGLSRDGQTAVGRDADGRAMSWTAAGGIVSFGQASQFGTTSFGGAISDDGRVIGGVYQASSTREGVFRWTDSQNFQGLGRGIGGPANWVSSMSADGNVMVGWSEDPQTTASVGFIWTPQSGLRTLPGSNFGTKARDVTADGSMVVGSRARSGGHAAFYWTESGGTAILSSLGDGNEDGASAVSANGRYIAGYSAYTIDGRSRANAVIWELGVVRDLGRLDGYSGAFCTGISDDGKTAVGILSRDGGNQAFVWTEASGMVLMRDYLSSFGVIVPDFLEFSTDPTVSGDGRTFAGIGGAPDFLGGGYVATIPCPGGTGLIFSALTSAARRGKRRSAR